LLDRYFLTFFEQISHFIDLLALQLMEIVDF